MPAIFTHIHFGREVAKRLPCELQTLTEEYPAAFSLGTQGPDILFYHKPLKKKAKNPVRKQGWDMHGKAAAPFFIEVAKKLVESGDGNAKAYALGFLCHFTLDSGCHPFIDEHSKEGLTHGKIEAELDKYFFLKAGYPKRGYNAAELFFPMEESAKAGAYLLEVPEKNMHIAVRSMRKINKLFSHKREGVHAFCHTILKMVGLNGSFGEMFLSKREDERCASLLPTLDKKFEAQVGIATEKIVEYFSHLEEIAQTGVLEDKFYRLNYSGKEEK